MFRVIYRVVTGTGKVNDTDGAQVFSEYFKISRGVIQGDIISSILFILTLDQLNNPNACMMFIHGTQQVKM